MLRGRLDPCTAAFPASAAVLAVILPDPLTATAALGSLAAWLAGHRLVAALLATMAIVAASFKGLGLLAALAGLAVGGSLLACGAARGWTRLVAISLASWAWAAAMLAGLSRPQPPPGLEWMQTRGGQAFLWLLAWVAAAYLAYNAYSPPGRPAGIPVGLRRLPSRVAGILAGDPTLPWRMLAVVLTVIPAFVEPRLMGPLLAAVAAWLAARLKGVRGPATLTMVYLAAYTLAAQAMGLGSIYEYALTQLSLHKPG